MNYTTVKFNDIETINIEKRFITNYDSLITLLGLFKVKYFEDNKGNFIIDFKNQNFSAREMDAIMSSIHMFSSMFSLNISTN